MEKQNPLPAIEKMKKKNIREWREHWYETYESHVHHQSVPLRHAES